MNQDGNRGGRQNGRWHDRHASGRTKEKAGKGTRRRCSVATHDSQTQAGERGWRKDEADDAIKVSRYRLRHVTRRTHRHLHPALPCPAADRHWVDVHLQTKHARALALELPPKDANPTIRPPGKRAGGSRAGPWQAKTTTT